jgi:hypothetical protein
MIGLTGRELANQEIVAAQLLARVTDRNLPVSVCLGVVTREHAHVIYSHGGEVWRVGQDLTRPELEAHVDREIDTSCDEATLIERVDHALGLFLGKTRVAA